MPESQELGFRSLVWQDSLEEEMVTHSSILARLISVHGGLQFMGLEELDTVGIHAHRAETNTTL